MIRLFISISLALITRSYAVSESKKCQTFFSTDSQKQHEICFYDFSKEKREVIISKECDEKKCDAYKAYESGLKIVNKQSPADMDHDWGVINCQLLKGKITYLTTNKKKSGEMRFCQFSDQTYIYDGFLDTSRGLGKP